MLVQYLVVREKNVAGSVRLRAHLEQHRRESILQCKLYLYSSIYPSISSPLPELKTHAKRLASSIHKRARVREPLALKVQPPYLILPVFQR